MAIIPRAPSLRGVFLLTNTDDVHTQMRRHTFGKVEHRHRSNFWMKISPPFILSKFLRTKLTPCSSVIQKRVICSSVIGSSLMPSEISLLKRGTTDPRLPTTLPYRTTENSVRRPPLILLALTKSLSLASLVAP